jgi:DNA-binding transcriptional LysR family regulator
MKPITLQRLQVFRTVYERASITAAARALKISQPTASRHLRDFELALGLKLFLIDKGRVLPTPEADSIYNESRFLDDGITRLERRIDSLRKGVGMRLPVMTVGLLSPHFVPNALRRTMHSLPGLRVSVDVGTSEQQIVAIRAGMVEVGVVVGRFQSEDVVSEVIGRGRLVVLSPADGPLAATTSVSLEDLVATQMLGLTARGPLGRILNEELIKRGLPYDDTVTGNTLVSVPHLVKAMQRSAVVDEFTAAFHGVDGLKTLDLVPALPFEVHAITRSGSASKATIQLFIKEMRSLLDEWSGP